jgi:NAD(P)-dependent dehydrogenase (short-subunit alcohol dehydrogenase family)
MESTNNNRLIGKAAVVTGAGQGLGKAHALKLSSEGAAVVVNDINAENANAVVEEIIAKGGKAIADINSVTDPEGAKKMIESCVENFGKIDILICNAGIVKFTNFADVTSKELHDVVDVSVWGSVYPVHAAWKYMNAEGYGRIVLTTSQAGLWGQANSAKLKKAYDLGIALGDIFNKCRDKTLAFTKLGLWHNQVENSGILSFESVARSIAAHHPQILHYFDNRSTNASAESFNAKLKAFRSVFRGVRDTTFFLYRVMKLYA